MHWWLQTKWTRFQSTYYIEVRPGHHVTLVIAILDISDKSPDLTRFLNHGVQKLAQLNLHLRTQKPCLFKGDGVASKLH